MHKPRSREDNVIAEEVLGNYVLYDSSTKRAHHLNSTLSWIWKHCDGSRTVYEMAGDMQRELGYVDTPSIVANGLKQLADADLLEPGCISRDYLAGASTLSRRAMIAGASIVAPMITSIVVPPPAAAKSKPDNITKDSGPKFKGEKKD